MDGGSIDQARGIRDEIREAGGLRRSRLITLTEHDIEYLKREIQAIEADVNIFRFNHGRQTGYSDANDVINVRGDIFSDSQSTHPRDRMSERAVFAHEYYGHRRYRNTKATQGSWNDEFRASYTAAKTAPNLSDEDRMYLMLDALQRAKDAGVAIKFNNFMRGILYGDITG